MYTMKDVCRKLNMSYDKLKYYCNEGLVPNMKRAPITIDYLTIMIFIGLTVWHV